MSCVVKCCKSRSDQRKRHPGITFHSKHFEAENIYVTKGGLRRIATYAIPQKNDFYIYKSIKDLAVQCEESTKKIEQLQLRCRTIGLLHSRYGKFWMMDINSSGIEAESKIRVSMMYLKSFPQSTVIPYPVQVFGTAQWKKEPVIFPKILQVLSVPMALRIRDIMNNIAVAHLATSYNETA